MRYLMIAVFSVQCSVFSVQPPIPFIRRRVLGTAYCVIGTRHCQPWHFSNPGERLRPSYEFLCVSMRFLCTFYAFSMRLLYRVAAWFRGKTACFPGQIAQRHTRREKILRRSPNGAARTSRSRAAKRRKERKKMQPQIEHGFPPVFHQRPGVPGAPIRGRRRRSCSPLPAPYQCLAPQKT
jgi:hypothetical protein